MAYKRQDFVDNETRLTALHMNNIQNGILDIQNDLYDTKVDRSYREVYRTVNINNPKYTNEYSSSVFSGWYGCVGKPSGFN